MSGVNHTICDEDEEFSDAEDLVNDPLTKQGVPTNPETTPKDSGAGPRPKPSIYLTRIKKDLLSITKDVLPGIFVVPDDNDLSIVHVLVVGVDGTPYEGGFFYFVINFTPNYPIQPPSVKLMTTDAGNVRFNPNLYKNGKVCLSILGTWVGPPWCPSLCLSSLLITIRSLLNEEPYHNEPGFEDAERCPGDSLKYNRMLRHETMRVAVCGMLENETALCFPDALREHMRTHFLAHYQRYRDIVNDNLALDGLNMEDMYGETRGRAFDYASIRERMTRLYEKLSSETPEHGELQVPGADENKNAVKPETVATAADEEAIETEGKQTQTDTATKVKPETVATPADEEAIQTEGTQPQTDTATEVKRVGDSISATLDASKHTQTEGNFTLVNSTHAICQTDELCSAVKELGIDETPSDEGHIAEGRIEDSQIEERQIEDRTIDEGPIDDGAARDDSKETQTEGYYSEARQVRVTESDEKQTQTEVEFSEVCKQVGMAGKSIGIC